jgi:hypothetical protein
MNWSLICVQFVIFSSKPSHKHPEWCCRPDHPTWPYWRQLKKASPCINYDPFRKPVHRLFQDCSQILATAVRPLWLILETFQYQKNIDKYIFKLKWFNMISHILQLSYTQNSNKLKQTMHNRVNSIIYSEIDENILHCKVIYIIQCDHHGK